MLYGVNTWETPIGAHWNWCGLEFVWILIMQTLNIISRENYRKHWNDYIQSTTDFVWHRPLPKAAPRSKTKPGRKRGKTRILTDTPEKCLIEEEAELRKSIKPFSNSKSRETWIQCVDCKIWAHEECTDGSVTFICQNCDSSDDLWLLTLSRLV